MERHNSQNVESSCRKVRRHAGWKIVNCRQKHATGGVGRCDFSIHQRLVVFVHVVVFEPLHKNDNSIGFTIHRVFLITSARNWAVWFSSSSKWTSFDHTTVYGNENLVEDGKSMWRRPSKNRKNVELLMTQNIVRLFDTTLTLCNVSLKCIDRRSNTIAAVCSRDVIADILAAVASDTYVSDKINVARNKRHRKPPTVYNVGVSFGSCMVASQSKHFAVLLYYDKVSCPSISRFAFSQCSAHVIGDLWIARKC